MPEPAVFNAYSDSAPPFGQYDTGTIRPLLTAASDLFDEVLVLSTAYSPDGQSRLFVMHYGDPRELQRVRIQMLRPLQANQTMHDKIFVIHARTPKHDLRFVMRDALKMERKVVGNTSSQEMIVRSLGLYDISRLDVSKDTLRIDRRRVQSEA